jgi:hypothetical protein
MTKLSDQLQKYLSTFEAGRQTEGAHTTTPAEEQEIQALVTLANTLRTVPHPELGDHTTRDAHARLVAAMRLTETHSRAPRFTWPWRPMWKSYTGGERAWTPTLRFAGTAAILLLMLMGGWGALRIGVWQQAVSTLRESAVSPNVETRTLVTDTVASPAPKPLESAPPLTPTISPALSATVTATFSLTASLPVDDSGRPLMGPNHGPRGGNSPEDRADAERDAEDRARDEAERGRVEENAEDNREENKEENEQEDDEELNQELDSSTPADQARGQMAGEPCANNAPPIPRAEMLAAQFATTPAAIMAWFCAGYGMGEIEIAYQISSETGKSVEEIFVLRASGLGWGQIRIQLGLIRRTGPSEERPD